MLNFDGSTGAYYIIALIITGWILGIVVPPISTWNRTKYIGLWAGPGTGRYSCKGFRWGYNKNTYSAFIIYNGPKMNFQIQTWRPRFAVWGNLKKRRAHIGLIQWVAKNYCVETEKNTWYGSNINHPYNFNVRLRNGASVAIGAMHFSQLVQALLYVRSVKMKTK